MRSRPLPRLGFASAIVVGTFLLLGCGGKVGDGSFDPELDAGDDATGDGAMGDATGDGAIGDATPIPDGSGGCGFGPCTPGTGCFDGCNTCECGKEGWTCTTMACVDAEPPPPDVAPPPDAGPTCPASVPKNRSTCPVEGFGCAYPNDCGGKTLANCVVGPEGRVWIVERGCAGCPPSPPPPGSGCSGDVKCGYTNPCGGFDTYYCAKGSWAVAGGGCPPPPPPPGTCPPSAPPDGAPCTGTVSCTWSNGCGGLTYGYCDGTGFRLKPTGCVEGCPASKPTSGSPCKKPSSTSCSYLVPGTMDCTASCFCAEDYRWACLPAPCSTTPSPGG